MLRESLLEQELGRVRTRPGLPGARRRLVQTQTLETAMELSRTEQRGKGH